MKLLDERDWPRLIRPGSRVFIGGGASVPFALVKSMLSQAERFKDVQIVHIHGLGPTPWIDPRYESILRTNSFFLTPALCEAVDRGQADYTPCAISEVPELFRSRTVPIDIALIQVTPPDAAGFCSLSVSVDVVKAAVQSARLVIAQVNSQMPRTGGEALIPVRKIDYFIRHDAPLPEAERSVLDWRHAKLARYASQLIEDGSTIQVGLGNSPDAVAKALRKHRNLGIHSGMLNDTLMELVLCGAVDHSAKNFKPGKIITSHAIGSWKLYQFIHENPDIEMHPSDWVNDPLRIARNHRMVAINGAREIDLTGQVARDSSGHKFYGGIGALQDFIRGAGHSKGGKPIIVLTSTSDHDERSRIVATLSQGSGVGTSRSDVHYVVTEYGIANIYGRSIRERVMQLVEIAHPKHREDLLAGALERGWLPRFFTMPATALQEGDDVESSLVDFNGQKFLLRPLHPSDMHALQEFFYSHDEETVRLRYGYGRDRMSGESAYKLAAVDQNHDFALGLFTTSGDRQELRAIGRYYLDESSTSAEVAFVVHEATRRIGMSGFLLGELATTAKRRGVKVFQAQVLPENRAMIGLFSAFGGKHNKALGEQELYFTMPTDRIARSRKAFLERKHIRIER